MTWSEPSRDSSDSAHSLSSGVFNAAGVQVKGSLGSSFISDVIRVERAGVDSAVKILTPGATRDPDLAARFLANARYNQGLNDFTGMRITEIVESGPRPYYVMEKVAESSLLEIIKLHAPIDPRWLCTLLLPVARMLDTIHQRNILHANIKPSNILVSVENGEEKFILVDFLEPSLAATSATMTAAGVYAAPEFRAGMPVSNRSDIYSLAAVMYEAMSGSIPTGAYRNSDGSFHVWRAGDLPRDLNQINPEISKSVSEKIMNGLSFQAISRPSSATALVEDSLRMIEQPRSKVRLAEPVKESAPVPMLLIAAGVFLSILLLFGAYKVVTGIFGGSDSKNVTTTAQSSSTIPDDLVTKNETKLLGFLNPANQQCNVDRSGSTWPTASATLDCTAPEVSTLKYGLFSESGQLDQTYEEVKKVLTEAAVNAGGSVGVTAGNASPCAASPNEVGEWGAKPGSGSKNGGKFICVSVPSPRILWTERNSKIIGEATLSVGSTADLVTWWSSKSGPK